MLRQVPGWRRYHYVVILGARDVREGIMWASDADSVRRALEMEMLGRGAVILVEDEPR
jgi:hypothetical protein